ncbi:hypothetical protein AB6A40_002350 [Gnathostoma spinigerum]|uniref:Replication protein A subunit n=1 Tax=Gnathostoma spinigerum TaxID=75299 RepID=A0ABD6EE29_9BILA
MYDNVNSLTRGFFQMIFTPDDFYPDQPILQVINARPLSKDNVADGRFKVRLSDGIFSYSTCINNSQISEKVLRDKLDQGNPVIRLNRYSISQIAPKKHALVFSDYEVLARDGQILGSPVAHTGDANDFAGMDISKIQNENYQPNMNIHGRVEAGAGKSVRVHGHGAANAIGSQNITPIKLITPYVNKWRICGVCTAKEDLRDIKTARREMKVFNFELTDEHGSCIRIAAFDDVADRFYAIIQKGSMYYVSGGTVKQANKRFNTTGHDYELTLRSDTEVSPCLDRAKIGQPKLSLNVVPLSKIAAHVNECVDVIGVIDKIGEVQQVTARATGTQLDKRDVFLIDQSGTIASLCVWGEACHKYSEDQVGQTLGIKGASVKEYNGSYSLSTMNSTRIELNPECHESETLYAWYKNTRPSLQATSISTAVTTSDSFARDLQAIGTAESCNLGKNSAKGAYFNICGMILTLKTDGALYKSCGYNGCKKKVIEFGQEFRCEKCDRSSSTFKYVLLLSFEIADFTGTHWVTMFDDQASKLLNASAETLGALFDSQRIEEYNDVFNKVRFHRYVFRLRARSEFYNDTERIKWSVFDVHPVPYEKYNDRLLKAIEHLKNL